MNKINLLEYQNLLENNPMSIATVSERKREREKETPNLAVAADIKVLSANQLLISHNEMVKTVENIKTNPAVCLMTFDENWHGLRMYGQAQYHATDKYYNLAKKLFTTKTCTPKGAIIVTINSLEEQS